MKRIPPAKWLFIVADGAVKTFRDLPSGRRRIANFLFRGDIFGLAEKGKARQYRAGADARVALPDRTGRVDRSVSPRCRPAVHLLCKVTHELREQQRRAIAIARRDAPGRLAMFLVMLRSHLFGPSRTRI